MVVERAREDVTRVSRPGDTLSSRNHKPSTQKD
jgi:hypothetical protein